MNEANRAPKAAIIGFLTAGAVLLGLSMFAQKNRGEDAAQAPGIEIIAVSPVGAPAEVRFVTAAPLQSSPMGWMADDLHLHVLMNTVDLMPGPSQVRHIAGDTFAWIPPDLAPGDHPFTLFWADMRHRPVGDSTSAVFRVADPAAETDGTRP